MEKKKLFTQDISGNIDNLPTQPVEGMLPDPSTPPTEDIVMQDASTTSSNPFSDKTDKKTADLIYPEAPKLLNPYGYL